MKTETARTSVLQALVVRAALIGERQDSIMSVSWRSALGAS